MPLAVDNSKQIKIARLLGVMFSRNLNFDEHVTFVLSICSQRLYLIELLRSQGMPGSKLHVIFVALIISRIFYALSAWGGFLNSQQISRIIAFCRKVRLLPPEKHHLCLRPRGHSYTFPIGPNNLCKSYFIPNVYFVFSDH